MATDRIESSVWYDSKILVEETDGYVACFGDCTTVVLVFTDDNPEQCGFSGAIETDEANFLIRLYVQRGIFRISARLPR